MEPESDAEMSETYADTIIIDQRPRLLRGVPLTCHYCDATWTGFHSCPAHNQ